MTRQEVLAGLQPWFVERLGRATDPEAPYLLAEGLDSFDAIQFIGFVEQRFSLQLDAEAIQSRDFQTLNGVAAVVQRLQEQALGR